MKWFYYIFLSFMLIGNCYGFVQLLINKTSFIEKFPAVNLKNIWLLQLLPLLNMAGITGLMLFKPWSPYVVLLGALLVIAADIYFEITYHLYVAVPSTIILAILIFLFKNHYK